MVDLIMLALEYSRLSSRITIITSIFIRAVERQNSQSQRKTYDDVIKGERSERFQNIILLILKMKKNEL